MIASRILWLPVAAAVVMGFGLAGAAAQTPNLASPPPASAAPNDPFGEEVTMAETTIIYFAGSGLWDSAFETIVSAFKSVYGALDKLGIKANGAPMTIYTATDDTAGWRHQGRQIAGRQGPQVRPSGLL
jgi:hypothetical protein